MRARALLAIPTALAATALPAPASACACGIAPQARIDVEHALVAFAGGRENLVISYDLRAAGKRPAVVLPVPAEPKVTAVGGPDPFAYLERVAVPPRAPSGGDEGAAPTAGAPNVKRSTIGGYAVTRLHGGSGRSVERWLHRNGYALPKGAAPILDSYVNRKWWFVALRLAKRSDGALEPLKLRFATARPVYPMRLAQLSTRPVNLDLYVATADRVQVAPLRATFSGRVSELSEPPPSSLSSLLQPGQTLTKLTAVDAAPRAFRSDLWPEPPPAPVATTAYRGAFLAAVLTMLRALSV